LFDTGNGWKAIAMIVGIDLILGPLLTFIVFNPKKSSLKFDLSIIALVQTAALIYGTWTIHQSRPIAIAFINTSFMTIFANSGLSSGVEKKVNQFNTIELYYSFDESKNNNLSAKYFKPYSKFALEVKEMTSAYKKNFLIQLDPLMSGNKYIKIDPVSGKILSFVKQPQ
jgi:hypothetical protein